MFVVALTGGIGSGKTIICKLFASCGAPVYDADEAAKRLMHDDLVLKDKLVALFGDVYDEQGNLKREILSGLVFNNPELLNKLNQIVHPAVMEDYMQWQNKQQFPYVMKESAILFESKTNVGLDYVIMVEAPEMMRIKRIMERDQRAESQIKAIINRQMPTEEKKELADFIIINDDIQPLLPQVWQLHEKFLNGNG